MANQRKIRAHAKTDPGDVAPTPEFMAHHAVKRPAPDADVPRTGWQVKTRVESLVDKSLDRDSTGGSISLDDYEAAQRWLRDHSESEAGAIKGTLTLLNRTSGGTAGDGFTARRIDATSRLMAARAAIGPHQHFLLLSSVACDQSWVALGRACEFITENGRCVTDKTAKLWVCNAIRDLRAHYDAVDGTHSKDKRAARMRSAHAQ